MHAIPPRLEALVEIFGLIDRAFFDFMATDQLFQKAVERFKAEQSEAGGG